MLGQHAAACEACSFLVSWATYPLSIEELSSLDQIV